ncbi:NADH dehydrogenase (quinone) [Rubrobacter xylanophilus DSM 9941]|uniref:NADH dehydrogenase (Quinone) n=1 Tax=Rubrobacter xylanophilus (strain DSM 9941 / JCM 11954 / NBRC 16129 / PRD-1) TaxID=266117 RepID=Q1AZS4_RUBXD|nr:proton-conducting transporter membrane subunit [Rubrobacter xylanophilus]ABG03104.1 NADH dehydrogenase (quinone) [Rubrobacter xylanophilus DSM 9941]
MILAATAILAPLAAAALILALRRLPAALALAGTGAGLAASAATLLRVAGGASLSATLPGLPGLPLRLLAEPLTALLSAVVAVVGFFVVVYAVGYMEGEGGRVRFFAGMSFFVAAMQALVLAGDWVLLLAAWELIGLSSYLLIGHRHEREGVPQAATRAFLYTRTADLGLYAAIFVLVAHAGTSEISPTLQTGGTAATAAGLLLLVAAMGKSAQTPLQGWLQDAMVGPTPVSALLHSATLVAAGAILMIRTSPLLPPAVLLLAGLAGGATALLAGLVALAERDLKRLLAASTSAQYGLMLLAVGAGSPVAALVHLAAHAAIKSALFLGSGVFQHARGSTRLDRLEGAGRARPRTFLGFAVAGLALAGVPPLSGYFTKDAILAAAFGSPYAPLLAPLALAGTLLTGAYVARALGLLWRGAGAGGPVKGARWMGAGLAALALLAAALGLAVPPIGELLARQELPEGALATVAGLAATLGGLALGWLVPEDRMLGPLRAPAERGFRPGGGLDALVARPALALGRAAARFDDGVVHAAVLSAGRAALAVAAASRLTDERGIDALVLSLARGTRRLGGRARELQTGLVHRELLLAAGGAALMLVVLTIGAAGT